VASGLRARWRQPRRPRRCSNRHTGSTETAGGATSERAADRQTAATRLEPSGDRALLAGVTMKQDPCHPTAHQGDADTARDQTASATPRCPVFQILHLRVRLRLLRIVTERLRREQEPGTDPDCGDSGPEQAERDRIPEPCGAPGCVLVGFTSGVLGRLAPG